MTQLAATTTSTINAIQKDIAAQIAVMQKILTIQDEELQILWWVVGEWSIMWERSFNDLDSKARPILLGHEAASMTDNVSELPSMKAVFSRIGIDADFTISIPEAVNACGVEYLKKIDWDGDTCPTLYPVHFAINRAQETGADDTWIAAWEKITNISVSTKISALELAIQMHRERKLIDKIESVAK